MNFKSQCEYTDTLPSAKEVNSLFNLDEDTILFAVFDKKLKENNKIKKWLETFKFKLAVKAGEDLKAQLKDILMRHRFN